MFLLRLSLLLFILTSFSANAEITIQEWKEGVTLVPDGRESSITISAIAHGLPKKSYHNGFSIVFDKSRNIQIKDVRFDSRQPKYSFKNNVLAIDFLDNKTNNQTISINYSYKDTYKKIDKYLRQEYISTPPWAKGARSTNIINIPSNLEIVSLNDGLKRNGNQLIHEGIVPNTGFNELIRLTPKFSSWNVKINNSIKTSGALSNLEVTIPIYFVGAGQVSNNNHTQSNPNPTSIVQENDFYILKYDTLNNNRVDITIHATLQNSTLGYKDIKRNPNDYLKVDSNDNFLLSGMLNQIKSDPKLQNLPMYARIGKFVNDYIKYDRVYTGKLLDTKTILELKKGVCVEYAKLFNILTRMAGIPSVIINGITQGEYDKFEGHSWNMIYYQNKWMPVDPTWNLMSGNVSSSHIYFYDDEIKAIDANWKEKEGDNLKVNLETNFEATPVN